MAEEEHRPDERPRPKYGELAPPGWVWKPPKETERLDTARHSPAASEPEQPVAAAAPPPPRETREAAPPHPGPRPLPSSARAGAPRWNLTVTILLLLFGLFGMTYSIATLQALPAAMQLLHSTQNLGDYTPDSSVGATIAAGSIALAAVWAVSAGLSVWLLVRRRLSFYVPLIAGIVALVVLFVAAGVVLATDPVLLDYYSGFTPGAPGTTGTPTPGGTDPTTSS